MAGQPGGNYQSGIGWRSVSGYNGKVIYISYALSSSVHITQVKLIFTWDSTPPNGNGYIRVAGNIQGFDGANNLTNTIIKSYDDYATAIDIAIGNGGYGSAINGTILRIEIRGEGTNPFNLDEINHETALDTAFTALSGALQANPTANVDALVGDYKDAIVSAFGVTFDGESGAPDEEWGATALHFAHQGLQATAKAFEAWVQVQLDDNECIPVDRFALFRRIMGSMTFNNVEETRENFAFSNQEIITIYQRPVFIDYYVQTNNGEKTYTPTVLFDGTPVAPPSGEYAIEERPQYLSNQYEDGNIVPSGRQAIMSPNNFIHELGHSLSRFSGFGFQVMGSIEYAIDEDGLPYNRLGMGDDYLRVQFYEHARVEDSNSDEVAEFNTTPLGNPPTNFNPSGYLQYDLFGTVFDLWNSDYNIYHVINMNARIDTLVHNPDASSVETAADAFLNWIRNSFDGTNEGQNWSQLFVDNIGIFLRNAAIRQKGAVTYYQEKEVIPNAPITIGTQILDSTANVRLTPLAGINGNFIGNTGDLLDPNNLAIYGWSDTTPSGTSPYWLLLADENSRLVWVVSGAIQHNDQDITPQTEIVNPDLLSPIRLFDSDDLALLQGE